MYIRIEKLIIQNQKLYAPGLSVLRHKKKGIQTIQTNTIQQLDLRCTRDAQIPNLERL